MVDIPAYLRQPLRSQLLESPFLTWRRNDTESGPPIYRKLYDQAPSLFSVTWLFDLVEFQAFEGWFKTQIEQGASSFIIPLRTGVGLVDHTCFFNGGYRPKQTGQRVTITAQLIAIVKQYDTDANILDLNTALQDLYDGGDTRPSETITLFQQFMTVDLPNKWAQFL